VIEFLLCTSICWSRSARFWSCDHPSLCTEHDITVPLQTVGAHSEVNVLVPLVPAYFDKHCCIGALSIPIGSRAFESTMLRLCCGLRRVVKCAVCVLIAVKLRQRFELFHSGRSWQIIMVMVQHIPSVMDGVWACMRKDLLCACQLCPIYWFLSLVFSYHLMQSPSYILGLVWLFSSFLWRSQRRDCNAFDFGCDSDCAVPCNVMRFLFVVSDYISVLQTDS